MRHVLPALAAAAATAAAAWPAAAWAQAPRFIFPGDGRETALIAQAAVVPAGADTIYLSGVPGRPEAGNTEAQTDAVLKQLGAILERAGFGFGDVVNMKVYLVGDPALGGKMDFAGMSRAYLKVFGTPTQRVRPSRVTVQVAGLALPGSLVEIELTAAKSPK